MTQIQIDCFLLTCQTLNLSQTAQELHYTPQGVSKLIASLEEELNLELFSRGNGLSLTSAGRYCRDQISRNQSKLVRTIGEIHGHYRMLANRFRLGISEWLDPYGKDIMRILTEYRKQEPDLEFSGICDSNDALLEALSMGEIDAFVFSGSQLVVNKPFVAEPLGNEHMVLVVPERICGKDWQGGFDPYCWGRPFMSSPVQNWGEFECKQVITKELAAMGIFPPDMILMPNVASLRAALLVADCVAIADARFGYMSRLPNMRYFPIKLISRAQVCCMHSVCNENPRIMQFIRLGQQLLGDITPESASDKIE